MYALPGSSDGKSQHHVGDVHDASLLEDFVRSMTCKALRDFLKRKRLPQGGNKPDLVRRVLDSLQRSTLVSGTRRPVSEPYFLFKYSLSRYGFLLLFVALLVWYSFVGPRSLSRGTGQKQQPQVVDTMSPEIDRFGNNELHLWCSGGSSMLPVAVSDDLTMWHQQNVLGETPLGVCCQFRPHSVAQLWDQLDVDRVLLVNTEDKECVTPLQRCLQSFLKDLSLPAANEVLVDMMAKTDSLRLLLPSCEPLERFLHLLFRNIRHPMSQMMLERFQVPVVESSQVASPQSSGLTMTKDLLPTAIRLVCSQDSTVPAWLRPATMASLLSSLPTQVWAAQGLACCDCVDANENSDVCVGLDSCVRASHLCDPLDGVNLALQSQLSCRGNIPGLANWLLYDMSFLSRGISGVDPCLCGASAHHRLLIGRLAKSILAVNPLESADGTISNMLCEQLFVSRDRCRPLSSVVIRSLATLTLQNGNCTPPIDLIPRPGSNLTSSVPFLLWIPLSGLSAGQIRVSFSHPVIVSKETWSHPSTTQMSSLMAIINGHETWFFQVEHYPLSDNPILISSQKL